MEAEALSQLVAVPWPVGEVLDRYPILFIYLYNISILESP